MDEARKRRQQCIDTNNSDKRRCTREAASLSNGGSTSPTASSPAGAPKPAPLPSVLSVAEFAKSRQTELEQFLSTFTIKGENKRCFQRLHKELRRRAQSHNPYRVPKNIRGFLLGDLAKTPPKDSKRSRQDRRRPRDLLEQYTRRSIRNGRWLETHIWHAKRMKMEKLWGYHLASTPNDKCQRKLYRHASRGCIIHDRSYMEIVQLKGEEKVIRCATMLMGVDPEILFEGRVLKGQFSTDVFLYDVPLPEKERLLASFARGGTGEAAGHTPVLTLCKAPLAPAEAIWRPIGNDETDGKAVADGNTTEKCRNLDAAASTTLRQLWLFVHPSAVRSVMVVVDQIVAQLKQYKFSCRVSLLRDLCTFELRGRQSLEKLLLALRVTKAYKRTSAAGKIWSDLLTAPNPEAVALPANSILALQVHPSVVLGPFPPQRTRLPRPPQNPCGGGNSSNQIVKDVPSWINSSSWREDATASAVFSARARRSTELPDQPRHTVRSKRRCTGKHLYLKVKSGLDACRKALADWNQFRRKRQRSKSAVGDKATGNCTAEDPQADLDDAAGVVHNPLLPPPVSPTLRKKRAAHVPKTKFVERSEDKAVPLLILTRPAGRYRNHAPGFDLIFPTRSGGRNLWTILCRLGSRAYGFRDRHKLMFELGYPEFPFDFVETPAGQRAALESASEQIKLYIRRPPSNRVNFALSGTALPFLANINAIVNRRNATLDDDTAPRSSSSSGGSSSPPAALATGASQTLSAFLSPMILLRHQFCRCIVIRRMEAYIKAVSELAEQPACKRSRKRRSPSDALTTPRLFPSSSTCLSILIPVRVYPHGRGVPTQGTHLFSPTKTDRESYFDVVARHGDGPRRRFTDNRLQCPEPEHVAYSTRNLIARRNELDKIERMARRGTKTRKGVRESCLADYVPSKARSHERGEGDSHGGAEDSCRVVASYDQLILAGMPHPTACRTEAGYISTGRHSFLRGQGFGIGFVSLEKYMQSMHDSLEANPSEMSTIQKYLRRHEAPGVDFLCRLPSSREYFPVTCWPGF